MAAMNGMANNNGILDIVCSFLLYIAFAGFVSWFAGEAALLEMEKQIIVAEPAAVPENIHSLPMASYPLFMDNIDASDFLFSTFQAESPSDVHKVKKHIPLKNKACKVIEGRLGKHETFYQAMARKGVAGNLRAKIIKGLSRVVNFRRVHAGDIFSVKLDAENHLVEADYEKNPFEVYAFVPDIKGGPKAFRKPVFMERRVNKMAGYIDDSLEKSLLSAGATPDLVRSFKNIFSSRIDMKRDVRQGDSFEIVYEEYFRKGVRAGAGRILAASYSGRAFDRPLQAFYFAEKDGAPGRYFDADGNSLEPDFLKVPLVSYRLTSRFTSRRFHPVLKKYFPHYGVDLAAPRGTPVMATADGRVRFAGWQRGFGRTVVLEHKNGIRTYYGHLSRFGKGIKRGKKVRQKQIIGYVGKSGVATGPHLDYRISVNGRFKDPFKMRSKASGRLSGDTYATFLSDTKALVMMLDDKFSGELLTETIKFDKDKLLPNG
jgi:murein DD-endopeptidase MepM/ murein hydrolase activator NlpD